MGGTSLLAGFRLEDGFPVSRGSQSTEACDVQSDRLDYEAETEFGDQPSNSWVLRPHKV